MHFHFNARKVVVVHQVRWEPLQYSDDTMAADDLLTHKSQVISSYGMDLIDAEYPGSLTTRN